MLGITHASKKDDKNERVINTQKVSHLFPQFFTLHLPSMSEALKYLGYF